jgi:L-alanine-DL-glutamate epimerase-like enolase superfamily enzyme
MDRFAFALPGGLPIRDGWAHLPEGPGLGMGVDMTAIDAATQELIQ